MVILDASTLTPPSCVSVAVARPIVPLEFVIPLVPTAGIITPPNAELVADVNPVQAVVCEVLSEN